MLLFSQSGRFPADEIIKNKRLAQSDYVLGFRLSLDYIDYMALYCNLRFFTYFVDSRVSFLDKLGH